MNIFDKIKSEMVMMTPGVLVGIVGGLLVVVITLALTLQDTKP